MSLETSSTLDDACLRYVLIGNNDMKYGLLCDRQFMDGFGRRFAANCAQQDWKALHDQAIVLRLLSTFDDINEDALDVFEGVVQLIVDQLDLTLKGPIDECDDALVEETVEYFLESLIHLSNHRFLKYDGEKLWNFVIQMLCEKRSLVLLNLLIRITPILLKCFKLAHHRRLLFILFALLHSGCASIVNEVFAYYNIANLDVSEVLQDLRLPNFDIPPHLFKENSGFSLIIPLLTSFLQIYNYMTENNLEFLPGDDFETAFGTVYITCLLLLKCSTACFPAEESKLVSVLSLNFICMYIEQTYNLRTKIIDLEPGEKLASSDVKNNKSAVTSMISKNYLKVLYKIDECFDYNPDIVYIHSPVKLLAHICDLFPSVGNNYIRNTTLDMKVRMTLIEQLKLNGWLFEFWHHAKDFTSLLDFAALDLMGKSSSQVPRPKDRSKISDYSTHAKTLKFGDVNCSSMACSTSLISDLLHLLSIYTSSEEDHRQRIIKDVSELPFIFFHIMETYRYLLLQLQINYRELKQNHISEAQKVWISKNVGIVIYLLDLPVFTNCIYFMRSLSRSVNALRTLFVECNGLASVLCGDILANDELPKDLKVFTANKGRFIYNILQIINGIECGTKIIRLLTGQTSQVQLTNKLIMLALISNLILDFLSFRLEIVNNSSFVLNLLRVYNSGQNEARNELELEAALVIQYHVLWVLKNLLYNENIESKRRIVQVFPLQTIMKNCAFDDVNSKNFDIEFKKKLVSFEILQNLTSGSPEFIRDITVSFVNYSSSHRLLNEDKKPIKLWDEFVIWNISNYKLFTDERFDDSNKLLLSMLENNKYAELVCSIFYIENHKYVSFKLSKEVLLADSSLSGDILNGEDEPMDGYTESFFPLSSILSIWLFFLQLEIPLDYPGFSKAVNNLTDINLAITWNLVNLTRKPNTDIDRWFPFGTLGNAKSVLVGRGQGRGSGTMDSTQTRGEGEEEEEDEDEDEDLDNVVDYDVYFELYDTVDAAHSHGSGPQALFGGGSLPRDIEKLGESLKVDSVDDLNLLTPEGRAAYLKRVGFTDALQGILQSTSVIRQERLRHTGGASNASRSLLHSHTHSYSAHKGIDVFATTRTGSHGEVSSLPPHGTSGFRRFEAVHSDDLVDKVRLANRQIFQLLMRNDNHIQGAKSERNNNADHTDKGGASENRNDVTDDNSINTTTNTTTTSSNINNNNNGGNRSATQPRSAQDATRTTLIPISAVSPLRDIMYGIQRGGEGFGYGLDEEYMNDEAVVMSDDDERAT